MQNFRPAPNSYNTASARTANAFYFKLLKQVTACSSNETICITQSHTLTNEIYHGTVVCYKWTYESYDSAEHLDKGKQVENFIVIGETSHDAIDSWIGCCYVTNSWL